MVSSRYAEHEYLKSYERIVLHPDESHSANTVSVDDVVVMSVHHKKTGVFVKEAGFDVVHLDMSEFEKCDGALTCLSVLF